MIILRLHHAQITIPKACEAAGRAFYCGVLGLQEIPKPDVLQLRGGFWLRLGNQQLHIGVEDGVDRQASKAHLAYEVDDLDAWRAKLAAERISILDAIAIPGYDRIEFRDPFGNRVELIQPSNR